MRAREHTDQEFEQELRHLREQLLLMGSHVEAIIGSSLRALLERDSVLARRTIEADRIVDRLEIEIDGLCLQILARRQPVASDLRFVTMVLKAVTDLERMGDLGVNISERVLELNSEPPLKPYVDLPRMAEISQDMVHKALDSLVSGNVVSAKKVCERDDEVDHLNDQIFRELISFMLEDKANITRSMDLILVARHLERIADHATNVAEDVIYLVEGRDIRHHRG